MTRRSKHDPEDLTHRINTTGAEIAYQALIEVCQDKKAQATARATAGTSLLRAAGRFDKDRYRSLDKPVEDMTPEEMNARILQLRARQNTLLTDLDVQDDDQDDQDDDQDDRSDAVFG